MKLYGAIDWHSTNDVTGFGGRGIAERFREKIETEPKIRKWFQGVHF
jgi:hypothetical protein